MLSNTKKQRQRHKHKGTKIKDLKSANGFYVEQDERGGSIVGTLIGFQLDLLNYIERRNCLVSIKKFILKKSCIAPIKTTLDIVLSVSRTQLKAGTGLFIKGATTLTSLKSGEISLIEKNQNKFKKSLQIKSLFRITLA